jgi:hypothetical protein
MRITVHAILVFTLLINLGGCSYLFYPRAKDYRAQAKASTGLETLVNLTTMIDASTTAARNPQTSKQAVDDLHNQLHALHDSFCDVTDQQATSPLYAKASTLKSEMWKIFKPLWKHRDDPALRDVHLDLMGKRNQELRETLQALAS